MAEIPLTWEDGNIDDCIKRINESFAPCLIEGNDKDGYEWFFGSEYNSCDEIHTAYKTKEACITGLALWLSMENQHNAKLLDYIQQSIQKKEN